MVIGHQSAALQKKPSPWHSPYREQVMDTQAGECTASQFILGSHMHRNTHTSESVNVADKGDANRSLARPDMRKAL